jgi:flavin reductase ActVB
MGEHGLDLGAFREAMARFASGVTVVTTRGQTGRPFGFTASAFASLSLTPPLVAVCLDRGADSYAVFKDATQMAISMLAKGQENVARLFATRGADKFGGAPTIEGEVTKLPLVPGAIAQLECRMHAQFDGGDHVILVGEVLRAVSCDADPLVHFRRSYGEFVPLLIPGSAPR